MPEEGSQEGGAVEMTYAIIRLGRYGTTAVIRAVRDGDQVVISGRSLPLIREGALEPYVNWKSTWQAPRDIIPISHPFLRDAGIARRQ
jgi:hypothetical protein